MLDLAIKNARIYTMSGRLEPHPSTSFGIKHGRFAGFDVEEPAKNEVDAAGKVILPGFIDCHTHAVYAGNRMAEHAKKLTGSSYEDIARSGGGIVSTVKAVRDASESMLVDESRPRLQALCFEGVTTVEIKIGYGLDLENELKMLAAAKQLGLETDQTIVTTFLGAHTIPPGEERRQYLDEIINFMLPAVRERKLADTVDIFVEKIAFDVADMQRLFEAALQLGFKLRAHTDQLSNMGATAAAARLGALSCDHLEYTNKSDFAAMKKSGTIAVLLPGAFYFLNETQKPPVQQFRNNDIAMAVASDLNPGSSPVASLLIAMHMACSLFGLTPAEALFGVTRNAARSLGMENEIGQIAAGRQADFTIWDIPDPEFLVYQLGGLRPDAVYIKGIRQ